MVWIAMKSKSDTISYYIRICLLISYFSHWSLYVSKKCLGLYDSDKVWQVPNLQNNWKMIFFTEAIPHLPAAWFRVSIWAVGSHSLQFRLPQNTAQRLWANWARYSVRKDFPPKIASVFRYFNQMNSNFISIIPKQKCRKPLESWNYHHQKFVMS